MDSIPTYLEREPRPPAEPQAAPLLMDQPQTVAIPVTEVRMENESGTGPPKFDDMEPPAYEVAVKLPTYEEAQQEKMASEERGRADQHHAHHHHHHLHRHGGRTEPAGLAGSGSGGDRRAFDFIAAFPHSDAQFDANAGDLALGTDVYFFSAFLMAFLFNWIGFLLLMCVCHTVAGRYGALAGFGLSLAKWTLIVKHSTDLASGTNNWLWWLIMSFGVLISVRAVIQYLCIKREWHRLSRAAQERVVFFY